MNSHDNTYNDFRYTENKTSPILGTSVTQKPQNIAVIATKPVNILFGKTIYNKREVN